MKMVLNLPWPPSLNKLYGVGRYGGRYLLPAQKRYRTLVWASVLEQRKTRYTYSDPVRIVCELYPPDRRIRDQDNLNKALLDSLEKAGVFANDNLVKDHRNIVRDVVRGGMVRVTIEPLQRELMT